MEFYSKSLTLFFIIKKMVLGLIKDYGSKIWEGVKSTGEAVGGLLKDYKEPILGALEGATGVLKYVPHPVVSSIAGMINTGLKSRHKVDDVPNEEIKKQLKDIQNDSEQLTPVSKPDPKTIINPTFDVVTRTPFVTVKPIIGGAYQHNILKGKAVPYDLMRFAKKHMKHKSD